MKTILALDNAVSDAAAAASNLVLELREAHRLTCTDTPDARSTAANLYLLQLVGEARALADRIRAINS